MPMKVEAAIVTQKRPGAAYNTDSVNVNGKVMPREVIKNGYKGSGVLSGSVYFALTSSDVEGFADASVAAFNERSELFPRARDPISVFSGFFEDCRGALLNMNRSEDELVGTGFYASGRKAVLAHNGPTKLYLQRLGIVTPVTTEKAADTTADFSCAVFNDVCEGDIFILLSPGASEVIGDKEIEDILRISDGSVKRIVNYILNVALAGNGEKAVSAIAVKVLETALEEEIKIPAFVPDFSEAKEEKADVATDESVEEAVTEDTADAPSEAISDEAETEIEEETTDTEDISSVFSKNALEMFKEADILENLAEEEAAEQFFAEEIDVVEEDASEVNESEADSIGNPEEDGKKKSRTPLFIILGMLIGIAVASIIAYFAVPVILGDSEEATVEESTTEEETTDEDSTAEQTTEEETTAEETTEEKTTKEETTTRKPVQETTTRKPVQETTTRKPVQETTTRKPVQETTKPAEEKTTATPVVAPVETTTAAENTTAEESEATTAAEEKTTAEEEKTTAEEKITVEEKTTSEATTAAASEASADVGQ